MAIDWETVPVQRGRLYESARWIEDLGVFQWVDILEASVHRWSPYEQSVRVESRCLGLEFVTVALPIDAFRSVVASRSSLYEYDWSTNRLDLLGHWDLPPDIRFNDGAVSPDGVVHIGTMSMKGRPAAGNLYRLSGGELVPLLEGVGISNGLCWVSETRAYYVDSANPRIDVLTAAEGRVIRERWLNLDEGDEPDGLTMTSDGTLFVANWGCGAIYQISPEGFRTHIPVPVKFPTSVALSRDERWMIVTSAAYGSPLGQRDGHVLVARRGEADDLVS